MKKSIYLYTVFILCTILCTTDLKAQSNQYVAKGLIRSTGNLMQGILLDRNAYTSYVGGCAEYYFSNRFSITGSANYMFTSRGTKSGIKYLEDNHHYLVGLHYNMYNPGPLNFYIGGRTGLSGTRNATQADDINAFRFTPLAGAAAGVKYYAPMLFNCYFEVMYLTGKHLADPVLPFRELRFNFGMGLHLWWDKKPSLKKPK